MNIRMLVFNSGKYDHCMHCKMEGNYFTLSFYCLLEDSQGLSDQQASSQYVITVGISKSHLISFLRLCSALFDYIKSVSIISTLLWRKWELPSECDRAEFESDSYKLSHLQRPHVPP